MAVTADLENGFADGPASVAETVRLAAQTGLAGCSVEDFALKLPEDCLAENCQACQDLDDVRSNAYPTRRWRMPWQRLASTQAIAFWAVTLIAVSPVLDDRSGAASASSESSRFRASLHSRVRQALEDHLGRRRPKTP